MKKQTILVLMLLTLAISLSACSKIFDPLNMIKENPQVAEFIADHPNADIHLIKADYDYVEQNIDSIKKICGEQMQTKAYYQATITDPDSNFKMVIYVDHHTKDLECLRKVNENTKQDADEESKQYKEEFINKTFEIHEEKYNLSFTKNESNLILSWNIAKEKDFEYYKIVQSKDNPNLQYPQDGYIEVITDINSTSYTTPSQEGYYRITYVSKESKYNSNVIEIKKEITINQTLENLTNSTQ